MAAGAFMEWLGGLLGSLAIALLAELISMGLDEDERAVILLEFKLARKHIWLTFTLKTSYFRQLPWALFAIGHDNLDVARSCLRRCLLLALPAIRSAIILCLILVPEYREQVVQFCASSLIEVRGLLQVRSHN